MSGARESDPILSVSDLSVGFETYEGGLRAVDGVSFDLHRGETVCVVGESGAGKTVTCEALAGLGPEGSETAGSVRLDGMELLSASEKRIQELRGDRIAYVFQHPQNSLDPVYTVGEQLAEVIGYHEDLPEERRRRRALDLLDRVDIANPTERLSDYPHELSGGMSQRVAVAMALAGDPDVLVADEPTADLDVTIQSQLLELFAELQAERDLAILYVTHDLGIVAGIADRVLVMYAGTVVERAPVGELFNSPAHPYTRALLRSLPGPGQMSPIDGRHPEPSAYPDGCRFHPRCPHAVRDCRRGGAPELLPAGTDSEAACVFYGPDRESSVVRADAPETPSDPADGGHR